MEVALTGEGETNSRAPRRIQRRRTKGWRMPDGAVYVGRPTRWGNPVPVAPTGRFDAAGRAEYVATLTRQQVAEIRTALRGKDLACWCPLDQPCHADILLEIANPREGQLPPTAFTPARPETHLGGDEP